MKKLRKKRVMTDKSVRLYGTYETKCYTQACYDSSCHTNPC